MNVQTALEDPVRALTSPALNRKIDAESERSVWLLSARTEAIDARLKELDREWDFDRVLEAEAAATGLLGVILAAASGRYFALMPAMAGAMVLLHALVGPYPLLPAFRRLGVRTQKEIDRERYALKAMRGDFDAVRDGNALERARAAWRAVNL